MRKYLIIAALLMPICSLFSSPIDSLKAKKVALNFMDEKRIGPNTILNLVSDMQDNHTLFYVVNFNEGGWVLVSGNDYTVPVLSYSLLGTYRLEDKKPDAFTYLVETYKERISKSTGKVPTNEVIINKWKKLLSGSNKKSASSYTPGDQLLDVSGRGHVRWNQSFNWNGSCSPRYNDFFPTGGSGCTCNEVPAGCGPVSMGQIMWYWEWPVSSSYRTYDWNDMPQYISNSTTQADADEIAHLLDDIGNEVNISELCAGSMATINNIEDAFNNEFGFEAAKKYIKNDWSYDSAWEDLLRSEIDNGRPILYRGDKSDLSTSKHIFVIDGYDSSDPDYFWFNFGWGNYSNTSYNTSRHYLSSITPSTYDYTDNQMVVVGISPTYIEIAPDEVNITSVTYTTGTGTKTEDAQQNISLPSTGNTLTIMSGGVYTLTAGNSIALQAGFKANVGSVLSAKINTDYQEEMDISVTSWTNNFAPNGTNDELCFIVDNADSWECEVSTLGGSRVFQSAGSINSSTVSVWDGSDISSSGYYSCHIRFKNNYGRDLENSYNVYVSF